MALSSWWLALDLALGGSLLGVAVGMFRAADAFSAIVLYITFGLLMALTWTRLGALDVALAEAAIGASVTGSLLLRALAELEARRRSARADEPRRRRSRISRLAGLLLLAPLGALLLVVVVVLPLERSGMARLAYARMEEAGVNNPVTAVLLSYRAYDTVLELVVLLLAVLGAWGLGLPQQAEPEAAEPVLISNVRLLAPASLLVGGYLLWLGVYAPGGAFQAGAVLAGAVVLVLLTGRTALGIQGKGTTRAWLVVGVVVFVLVGLSPLLMGEPFLFFRGRAAKALLLIVELAATASIAAALAAIFAGRRREEEP